MIMVRLTDNDVQAYLDTKQPQDVIGEKNSCLLTRAVLHTYPGVHVWVSAQSIHASYDLARLAIDATPHTSKQHQQMFLHDELARSGPVTKQAFLEAWGKSWCATIPEWNV